MSLTMPFSLTFSLSCGAIYIGITAKNSHLKHNYYIGRERGSTRRAEGQGRKTKRLKKYKWLPENFKTGQDLC